MCFLFYILEIFYVAHVKNINFYHLSDVTCAYLREWVVRLLLPRSLAAGQYGLDIEKIR